MRPFQTELFSSYLPSTYAGHVNLAAAKHWQFMPNWKDGSTVELIIFRAFLPKYRFIYYDYIVKWCSGIVVYNVTGVYIAGYFLNVSFNGG